MDQNKEDDREKPKEKPKFMFLGRDMTKIPCFRKSILGGFTTGVGAGILTFMFTSRVRLASHTAFGTMSVVTLGYFVVCRYQFAKEVRTTMKIKGLMNEVLQAEGAAEHDNKMKELNTLIEA